MSVRKEKADSQQSQTLMHPSLLLILLVILTAEMDNPTTYILAGWLIDGSGGPVQKKVLLRIENGVFIDLTRFDGSIPLDHITDLSHCTILPPLVDSHVHLAMSSTIDNHFRLQQLEYGYSDIHDLIAQNIHYHFSHGVMAVRDAGDRLGHVLQYRNETAPSNTKDPVILKTAGKAWHTKGRYGGMLSQYPTEKEALDSAVARETSNIDFVKIINSGPNSLVKFGRETPPQFNQDELYRTVQLAEKRGQKVMVHANGELPVRLALESGCHSIEHGYFMGLDNLKRMADKNTVWVPTAYAMRTCAEKIDKEDITIMTGVAEKTLQHQLEQIARAREFGVTIALGTDAGSKGVIHGESLVEEMKFLIRAGYSLPEAIQCATLNGSKLLGIDNKIGLIGRGRPANFLVTRGTPAQLPRKLSYLEGIYLNGSPCRKDFFEKV